MTLSRHVPLALVSEVARLIIELNRETLLALGEGVEQVTQQKEVTTDYAARFKALAEAMRACDNCLGRGEHDAPKGAPCLQCSDCRGSGKVPAFPRLSLRCDKCNGRGQFVSSALADYKWICEWCRGSGRAAIPYGLTAAGAMLETLFDQGYYIGYGIRGVDGYYSLQLQCRGGEESGDWYVIYGPDLPAALVEALEFAAKEQLK